MKKLLLSISIAMAVVSFTSKPLTFVQDFTDTIQYTKERMADFEADPTDTSILVDVKNAVVGLSNRWNVQEELGKASLPGTLCQVACDVAYYWCVLHDEILDILICWGNYNNCLRQCAN